MSDEDMHRMELRAQTIEELRDFLDGTDLDLGCRPAVRRRSGELIVDVYATMPQIERLQAELGAGYSNADLTRAEAIEAMMEEAGPVDILVNNAGTQHVAPVDQFPVDKWDLIIALNLTAAVAMLLFAREREKEGVTAFETTLSGATPSLSFAGWRLLVAAFFYGMITPMGLTMRLFGRDKLQRKNKRASYWDDLPRSTDRARYERQF